MALTEQQMQVIELGLRTLIAAVSRWDPERDGPFDWSRLRITQTPAMALDAARRAAASAEKEAAPPESPGDPHA